MDYYLLYLTKNGYGLTYVPSKTIPIVFYIDNCPLKAGPYFTKFKNNYAYIDLKLKTNSQILFNVLSC